MKRKGLTEKIWVKREGKFQASTRCCRKEKLKKKRLRKKVWVKREGWALGINKML